MAVNTGTSLMPDWSAAGSPAPGGRIFVGSGGATPSDGGTLQAYDTAGTSDDRRIHAFDVTSHAELWDPFPVDGSPGSPAIVDGRIVVGTSFGEVFSITGSNGSPGIGGSGSGG